MKTFFNKIINATTHIGVIIPLMLITLLIVDICNPYMEFINNNITKALILVLCISSVTNAIASMCKKDK